MSKKILIVTDFYEPHKSGIVTYIAQLIESLKQQNHKVTILTTRFNKDLKEVEYLNGVKVIRCKPTLKISRGFYSIELVVKFIKLYKAFDIVNFHLPLVEIFPIIFFLKENKLLLIIIVYQIFYFYLKLLNFIFIFLEFVLQ